MDHSKHAVHSRGFASSKPGKLRTETFEDKRGGRQALDRQAMLLLAVQGLIAVATALSGTFLPIYLWKVSKSFALIGWFNFTLYTVSGLTFWIAGKWVKEHNKMNSLRLGIMMSGVFYFIILLLGSKAVTYAIPLGILGGLGQGFFWLAYNVVYFEITEPGNRDRFNGWTGLIGSGTGIAVPWISGFIITAFHGERGYSIIYTASAIIFGIAMVLSFWLKKREATGRYDWFYGFRQLRNSKDPWRRIALATAAQGIRDGVFMFLIGLLIYMATNNEQKLGSFSLVTSVLALISFWAIGKFLRPNLRSRAMLIGAVAVTIAIFPLFWSLTYRTMLTFGIGTAIFMPLFIIPMTSIVFDLIGRNEESAKRREELVVLREASLTVGRIIGITAYLLVLPQAYSMSRAIPWLMLVIGACPLICWFLVRRFLGGLPAGSSGKDPV
ncbi:MFS transporter [Paenibacillus nasutitermitis]|uniref:Uncharacterized protein n=1 Tax=Paenibacillus nasutitermitis TaxID=1652958 RepID=A0A916YKF0_9BACL|nr:MFS transporter [Paenibacillus nasutitermitis]GGD48962.1 hypothetical protein GCM10010911_03140 [Paenibacillus nasutitermitis]